MPAFLQLRYATVQHLDLRGFGNVASLIVSATLQALSFVKRAAFDKLNAARHALAPDAPFFTRAVADVTSKSRHDDGKLLAACWNIANALKFAPASLAAQNTSIDLVVVTLMRANDSGKLRG
jgi:hypothetical protein